MANRRLAISSLLSSDSSTPSFGILPSQPLPSQPPLPPPAPSRPLSVPEPEPEFEPASMPLLRHASPPIHFSLPAALTRRTPSPTTLDDAPPAKRHKSDSDPHAYVQSRAYNSLSRQYSPADPSQRSGSRAQKVSYNNPDFYSPRPFSSASSPRGPEASHGPKSNRHSGSTGDIHDGLSPVPLATFSATTNTEQRWVESRAPSASVSASGSGTHSPVTSKPDYLHPSTPALASPSSVHNTASAALSVGAKVLGNVRASLIEERSSARARHSSTEEFSVSNHHGATPPLARLPPASPLRDYSPAQLHGSALGYPSSSERERRSPPRSASSSLSPVIARKSASSDEWRPSNKVAQKNESPDAHDWLVDRFTQPAASVERRIHRGPGMHFVDPDANTTSPRTHELETLPPSSSKLPETPPSMSVDDELLSLIDGPDSSSKPRKDEIPAHTVDAQPVEQAPIPAKEAGHALPSAGVLESSRTPDVSGEIDQTKAKSKKPRPSGGRKKTDGKSAPRQRKKAAGARRSMSAMPGSSRVSSPNPSTPGAADDDMDIDLDLERPSAATDTERSPSKREKLKKSDDNKLYCICKMPYDDDDKEMIACDKCDEWYHTACVDLAESDIELVDQFVCPICQSANPSLQTSYKARCLRGRADSGPSPSPCGKAARMPISKYCSEECGLAHVRERMDEFNKKGGMPSAVWEAVKAARKVEGLTKVEDGVKPLVVVVTETVATDAESPTNRHPAAHINGKSDVVVNGRGTEQNEMQMSTLRGTLVKIAAERDGVLRALDHVRARERLIKISSRRSETVAQCGWDERLLLSDVEWQAWVGRAEDGGGAWLLDGLDDIEDAPGEGDWWCTGKQKCDRHNGWQKLRLAEVETEKALKNQLLHTLTAREREIRRCIEDLEPPVLPALSQNGHPKMNGKSSRAGGPKRR